MSGTVERDPRAFVREVLDDAARKLRERRHQLDTTISRAEQVGRVAKDEQREIDRALRKLNGKRTQEPVIVAKPAKPAARDEYPPDAILSAMRRRSNGKPAWLITAAISEELGRDSARGMPFKLQAMVRAGVIETDGFGKWRERVNGSQSSADTEPAAAA